MGLITPREIGVLRTGPNGYTRPIYREEPKRSNQSLAQYSLNCWRKYLGVGDVENEMIVSQNYGRFKAANKLIRKLMGYGPVTSST